MSLDYINQGAWMDRAEMLAMNLRMRRAALRISQKEIGRAIGVSAQVISSWEKGRAPSMENLWKLADFYGVSVDELIGREVPGAGR